MPTALALAQELETNQYRYYYNNGLSRTITNPVQPRLMQPIQQNMPRFLLYQIECQYSLRQISHSIPFSNSFQSRQGENVFHPRSWKRVLSGEPWWMLPWKIRLLYKQWQMRVLLFTLQPEECPQHLPTCNQRYFVTKKANAATSTWTRS